MARKVSLLDQLKPSQREDLGRLRSLGDEVMEVLFELVPYEGLWPAFDLGRIRLLQRLHCPEVEPSSRLNIHGLKWYTVATQRVYAGARDLQGDAHASGGSAGTA